ncbi:MAG: hypothetical protein KGM49_07295 [Sphingomonadales bacterium]|nr:hypothetical protein [Sphingomonadales bacterium]
MTQPRSAFKLVSLSALAVAMLAPLPAAAHDSARRDDAQRGLAEVEGRLSDPAAQRAIGDAMAGMMAAMLDMKAAPFLKAMDRMGASMGERPHHRAIPDDATLGDLAGPETRHMPDEVARKAPAMMGAAGAMVGAMGEMLPQLEEMGKRMTEQMRRSIPQSAD